MTAGNDPGFAAGRIRLIRDTAGAADLSRDDYERGFRNGLELALSVLENRQPALIAPCEPSRPVICHN